MIASTIVSVHPCICSRPMNRARGAREILCRGRAAVDLRDVAKKLTFVPAGRDYREWYDPRTLTAVTYFYFDPAVLQAEFEFDLADVQFAPRLFFEDATIWSTVGKLKRAIEAPESESRLYVEALGVVLVHELIRLNRGARRVEAAVRGGLAAWQQRIVTAYIDEHLSEQVSLATLAQLARLSTYYFCRAFKQSFGVRRTATTPTGESSRPRFCWPAGSTR